ncbi:MAG TPA: hypothetical protein PL084_13200, partial [Chitinophagales bacterium]|nr:hypothetical protein [Chitinophagales bacterium]
PDPQSFNHAFSADFKQNSTNGLADGGTYNGVLSFRPYGGGTDFSGGPMHQLGFTDNGNLWMRTSTGNTTWGNWKNISVMRYATNHSFNIPSYNGGVTYKTWWFPMEGAEGTDDAITMGRPQTMVAPYGGRLVKIIIVADETSSNSGVEISNATFALSVNQSDYSSPTPTYVGSTLFSINEGESYAFIVPSTWTFSEGSRLRVGLRFNGTAGYVEDNDYFVTCVWEYNQ